MCVAALNAGRRQATRHWHSSDSSNWYQCMFLCVYVCVCVSSYVCMCVCFSVCCVPLTYFRVVGYMRGHGSRTGSSQLVWCWARTLGPSSSIYNPHRPSHTRAFTQTHTLHTQHALTLDYHTYHCTLVLPWRSGIICVPAHSWHDQTQLSRGSWQWWDVKCQNESLYLFKNFKFTVQIAEHCVHI